MELGTVFDLGWAGSGAGHDYDTHTHILFVCRSVWGQIAASLYSPKSTTEAIPLQDLAFTER
jgi:hypothetical protein